MFKDAFTKLDKTQAAKMATLISPFLDVSFNPSITTAMIHRLPFYKGYFLCELSSHTQTPALTRTAVCNDEGTVYPLDWTNTAIYNLNKIAPLQLDENTLLEYVRFFFSYVRGAHGQFQIVDTIDDINWREEPLPSGRKALARMINPLHIYSSQNGHIVLRSSLVFKDSLFSADIHVLPDGRVSISDEEILVEDIPVVDDLFDQ